MSPGGELKARKSRLLDSRLLDWMVQAGNWSESPQLLDSRLPDCFERARLLDSSTLDFSTGISMTVPGRRAERLADQIRAEVAEMISAELKDPRIGFATVTEVDMSGDLHHARVSVSVLGSADAQQKSLQALTSAAGYIRHELGHRLRLRRVPELTFVLDHAAEENERLEMLLQKLKKEP